MLPNTSAVTVTVENYKVLGCRSNLREGGTQLHELPKRRWPVINIRSLISKNNKKKTTYYPQKELTFLKLAIKLMGTQPWSSMFCRKNVSLTKFALLQ